MVQRIISLSYIMQISKECGKLRKEGKFKKADKMEKDLQNLVKSCDTIDSNYTRKDLEGRS